MAIPDSSKLGLMRNLKAITKKDIEALYPVPFSSDVLENFPNNLSTPGLHLQLTSPPKKIWKWGAL